MVSADTMEVQHLKHEVRRHALHRQILHVTIYDACRHYRVQHP